MNTLDKKNVNKNNNIHKSSFKNKNNKINFQAQFLVSEKIQNNNNNNNHNISNLNNTSDITTNPNITQDKSLFSSPSERIYIGKYVGGQKNGQGKLLLPNESEYEGNFKNNEFDGYGVFKSKTYNYWGNFIEGKKNGKGKYEDLIKDSIYEGEFVDDKKNGYGEEKYNDGIIYKGQFKDGLKEGKGTLILKKNKNETDIYEGEFKEDKICGIGRIIFNNKNEYYGEWENNEMTGYGMFLDGQVRFFGYFEHNMKEGFGALFYEDQSYALLGKWEEDLCEGPSILIQLNKRKNKENVLENDNIIVGMYKGEIINMNLGIEDINTFKSSEDYQEMTELFKNKFYPDFLKYINNSNDKE